MTKRIFSLITVVLSILSCTKNDVVSPASEINYITQTFGNNIDLANLEDYAGQRIPNYITKVNGANNPISNIKATLGRVLFYDKQLSIDNSISCGSCHKQEFAFSDTALRSDGVSGGLTTRHSMRLINTRFALESKFFWDERAASLEQQTTMPIQDHAEMGFSGLNGRGTLSALLTKLSSLTYYNQLFKSTYGDTIISEQRMQECLAQFVRSIQSFDSKYDVGRARANNPNENFFNFTPTENAGKDIFTRPPTFDQNGNRIAGGIGCNGCHNAPEFDIDPISRNNGIIGIINNVNGIDLQNTRAPSLRDLTNANGIVNSPMMHTGQFNTLKQVLEHYQTIENNPANTNLDNKLRPNGIGQKLNMTDTEMNSVVAFLSTLSGTNVYTDKKWSNPFTE